MKTLRPMHSISPLSPMNPMRRLLPPAMAAALMLALGACGGGTDVADVADGATAAQARVVSPLLDDQARPLATDPRAVPRDGAALTRSGRYATAAQADQLEHALGALVIPLQVEPVAGVSDPVALAVQIVHGVQAAHGLGADAPVLVRSRDLRLAAAAANRLEEAGHDRVFLVTDAGRL